MENKIYCDYCGYTRPADEDKPDFNIKKGDILHFNKKEVTLIADTRVGKIYQCFYCKMIKIN